MPRTYEAVYIFDSTLEDAAINDKITRFHRMLTANEQPEVTHWDGASSPTPLAPAKTATTSSRSSRPSLQRCPSTSGR